MWFDCGHMSLLYGVTPVCYFALAKTIRQGQMGAPSAQHHPVPIAVVHSTGEATLSPGKNAVAAEGSQWQWPELAKEHSGGGQR